MGSLDRLVVGLGESTMATAAYPVIDRRNWMVELVCAGHYEWRTERVKVAEGGYTDETLIGFKF